MEEWRKPVVIVLDEEELAERIIANARSGCGGSSCLSCWSNGGWPGGW